MQNAIAYHSQKLKEALTLKQRNNPRYSLRGFSQFLGMHPSTLALVMSGKRPLPAKNIEQVVSRLELTPREEAAFRRSAGQKKSKLESLPVAKEYSNRYLLQEESYYKVIAEWEHYAVITLLETDTFRSCDEYISKKLGIDKRRLEVVMENLLLSGLVAKDDEGVYRLTQGPLRTTEDVTSRALRASHKETLEMGKNKLDEVALELRDFSSMTIAVNPNKVQEAKSLLREFRQKMASLLKEGETSEVYQMAIQLYPLTDENI